MKIKVPKHTFSKVLVLGLFVGVLYLLTLLLPTFYLLSRPLNSAQFTIGVDQTICTRGVFFFPSVYQVNSEDFRRFFSKTFTVNGHVIYSDTICFTPKRLLTPEKEYLLRVSPPKLAFLSKEINLSTKEYSAVVENKEYEVMGVNVKAPLQFSLDGSNTIFDYFLTVEGKEEVKCEYGDSKVTCDIEKLSLDQGSTYSYIIVSRYFNEIIKTELSSTLKTKTPVLIESSSLDSDSLVNSVDPQFTINLSKEVGIIEDLTLSRLGSPEEESVDSAVTINGKSIVIKPTSNLEKNTAYELIIPNVVAIDGSFLDKPYRIEFQTADGPRVISSNTTSIRFPTTGNIVITFDQNLLEGQEIFTKVSLTPKRAYTYSIYENQLVINPNENLGQCESNTISVGSTIVNSSNISGSFSYSKNFRTNCARVGVAGYSVQGRPIYAYYYGNGPKRIIYFGSMHGSESNTRTLLNLWLDELEASYSSIPADKTVIVVPSLNPDGVAASKRFNAHDVDLNRNFGGSDWQSESFWGSYIYPNGGGSKPFSEPESSAIRNLILSNGPYLTVSFHSAAAYVVPNALSTSVAYGQRYSQQSGYKYIAPSTVDAFDYGITGSFGIWAQESGYPSLTVELSTGYAAESSRNFPAMWNMLQ